MDIQQIKTIGVPIVMVSRSQHQKHLATTSKSLLYDIIMDGYSI